jgi:ribosomal protein S6E (S10)
MPFKLNISDHGKAWKLESSSEMLIGKKIGDHIHGKELSEDLEGYDLEITGASDSSGFPHKKDVEGITLKRVLLSKGWGMWKRPRKAGKKKRGTPRGLRLRKTVRGRQLSEKTTQINLKVLKHGGKKLLEIFPDQNKPKEKKEAQPVA